MSTMTNEEIIRWAREHVDAATRAGAPRLAEKYRRLADLAEKGAEDWQPIATAPGTEDPMGEHEIEVLVSDPHEGVTIAVRRLGWWYEVATDDRLFPTHWRPLPEPPEGA